MFSGFQKESVCHFSPDLDKLCILCLNVPFDNWFYFNISAAQTQDEINSKQPPDVCYELPGTSEHSELTRRWFSEMRLWWSKNKLWVRVQDASDLRWHIILVWPQEVPTLASTGRHPLRDMPFRVRRPAGPDRKSHRD